MSVWFEGSDEIACTIGQVWDALENHSEFYVGVLGFMPGLTSVELVDHGPDSVVIRTNEGLSTRTNLSKRLDAEQVVVEFDEEYQAGSKVMVTSHFRDEFTASNSGVKHRTVVSDVAAPGVLGFLYRKFGSGKMGKAFLSSHRAFLENL